VLPFDTRFDATRQRGNVGDVVQAQHDPKKLKQFSQVCLPLSPTCIEDSVTLYQTVDGLAPGLFLLIVMLEASTGPSLKH